MRKSKQKTKISMQIVKNFLNSMLKLITPSQEPKTPEVQSVPFPLEETSKKTETESSTTSVQRKPKSQNSTKNVRQSQPKSGKSKQK
jgi:hypothetical protein